MPSGNYIIFYSLEFYDNAGGVAAGFRVQINNTDTIAEGFNYDDYTTDYRAASGFYYAAGISGSKSIDLDVKASGGGATIYVRRRRLAIWRVG